MLSGRAGQRGARGDEDARHVDGDDARGDVVDGELVDGASGVVRATRRRSERISRGCPSRPSRSRGRGTREAGAPTARLRRDVRARRRGRRRRSERRERAATTQDLQRERRCVPTRGARRRRFIRTFASLERIFLVFTTSRARDAPRRDGRRGDARARDRASDLALEAGRRDAGRARVTHRPETRISTRHTSASRPRLPGKTSEFGAQTPRVRDLSFSRVPRFLLT